MYNAQNLINRIKIRAKEQNILIKTLLIDCDLSINTINQITDKKGLSSFSLAKIADRLGCSTDYLLGRTDDPLTHQLPIEDEIRRADELQ